MARSLAVVVAAILLSRPELPRELAERWAEVVREVSRKHGVDALSVVALVHHESGWRPEARSASGEDLGLGQVRARFVGGCRGDPDPVGNPSEACRATRAELLDPEANLRHVGEAIGRARALCRAKVGTDALPRWLAAYQGRNYPKQRRWCVPGEKTWQIVRARARIEAATRGRR